MIGVKLPDGRTVNVDTTDPKAAASAARRMLAREAITKSGMGGGRKQDAFGQAATSAASGATFGLSDVMDGAVNAGITGVKNLGLRAQGKTPTYGMGDAYAADRQMLKERAAEHPTASGAGGLLGGLGSPVNGPAAEFVTKGIQGAKGLLSSVHLIPQALRSAAVGTGLGGLSGAATADPGHELEGARSGAITGGVVGGVLPGAGAGVGKLAQAGKGGASVIARAANKVSGGKLLDTGSTATKRLADALKADGATPEDLRAGLNAWLKSGASSPTLMDLATKLPSGGANTMRLLTGAALKGRAAGAATQYAAETEAALPDNVIARARKLTPDTRPASVVADELKGTQRSLASEQYAPAYATPVEVTPEVRAAVQDEPGRAAVQRAIRGATARQDYDAAGRLGGLMDNVPDMPGFNMDRVRAAATGANGPVTAGDLDRVRIAMGERGEKAMNSSARDVAGGLFGRAKQIDSALDAVPELQPARQTYRAMQGQRNALEEGTGALSAMPDEYEAAIQKAMQAETPQGHPTPVSGDDIQGMAAIGHRQAITDAVGQPAAGATGVLNRLANSPNQIRNQDVSFGPQAEDFRDAVSNEMAKVANARHIDPGTNSRTADRLGALMDIEAPKIPHTLSGAILGAVNKLRQGATLTDEERHAIVQMGLAKPEDFISGWHADPTPILDAIHRSGSLLAPAASAYEGRQ